MNSLRPHPDARRRTGPPVVRVLMQTALVVAAALGSARRDVAAGVELAPAEELAEVERRILEILPRIEAATVNIQGAGSGSGVVVSADGLVLTAAHVVDGQTDVVVTFVGGRKCAAKVLGSYGPGDAAMVQITEGAPHPFADVAAADATKVGDTCIAMGHPAGFDAQRGIPLRLGHVIRLEGEFMAIDCALINGDSGGPSFNLDGQVIGIHSHVAAQIAENNDGQIGAFLRNWKSLTGGVQHETHYSEALEGNAADPWVIGVKLETDLYGERLVVEEVVPQSPAERAGLLPGDEILLVAGQTPANSHDFLAQVRGGRFGVNVTLTVNRDGDEREYAVRLVKESQLEAARAAWAEGRDLPVTEEEEQLDRETAEALREKSEDSPQPGRPSGGKADDAEDEAPSRLSELAKEVDANSGRMRVSRDELLKLRASLALRTRALSPDGRRTVDPWNERFTSAYSPFAKAAAHSVFVLSSSSGPVALATAVRREGLLVTKLSEVQDRVVSVMLDRDTRVPAEVVATEEANDLALLHIPVNDLVPVELAGQTDRAPKGRLCASIGANGALAGHGIVCVGQRALNGKADVYLGVTVEPHEHGLKVTATAPNSPAAAAGILADDVLTLFDGQSYHTPGELAEAVKSRQAEDVMRIDIERGDSLLSAAAVLQEGKTVALPGAAKLPVDDISTKMSRRRWNFQLGIEHDCAIRPEDCGGPLVDLRGRVVGINVARAGRIKSYAIPASEVAAFVANHPAKEPE